jgi:hypothetical protein
MKNVLLVVCVALLLGCSGQAPEGENSVTIDGDRPEAIFTENFEDGQETKLQLPPDNALPLSEIIERLETAGYTTIIDAEFEDGVWEIEHVVDGEEHELHVDPVTGEILPAEPRAAAGDASP